MATFNGNGGIVKTGSNAIAEVLDFSVDETANTVDDTVLGDVATTHLEGLHSWSGTANCYWDDTDTSGQVSLTIGSSITLNLQPEGDTTGDALLSGTATITGIGIAVSNDTTITQSFTFTGNGVLVIGTVPA